MDLELGPHHARLREDVRTFLDQHWPADDEKAFRRHAIDRGLIYRHVPREYGGSEQPTDPIADDIIEQEFTARRAPLGIVGEGPDMIVPTLLSQGTEEQRREFIAPTLLGDIIWCQGYSEPSAGSDLASLKSRAELDGDEWVIHGHKVWNTGARNAHWMFGLFRTEPEIPRHGGLTFLLIPMDQPGIEVQPIKAMTGHQEFNEVFLEGARTPVRYTVGGRGNGWAVSRSLLVHERNLMGFRSQQLFNNIVDRARDTTIDGGPALEDGALRRTLVDLEADLLAARYSRYRALSNAERGNDPNAALAGVVKKLHATGLVKRLVQVGIDLAGADEALRDPGDATVDLGRANEPGGWALNYMYTHAVAIGGGAPNIQRNIIGERGLGLPRDLRTPAVETARTSNPNRGDGPS